MDWTTIAGLIARHVMTSVFGALLTLGLVQAGDQGQFVTIASGVIVGLCGLGWSWWKNGGQAKVAADAAFWRSRATMKQGVQNMAASGPANAAVIVAAVLAGMLYGSPSHAADMVKASPKASLLPMSHSFTGSGPYFGVGTFTAASKANVADQTMYAVGASLGGIAGWAWGNQTTWTAIEGGAYWQNLGGSSSACQAVTPCDLNSKFTGRVRVIWGGSLDKLSAVLNFSTLFPVLTPPPGGFAQNASPYLYGVVNFDDVSASLGLANARAWEIPFGAGVGMRTLLTNGTAFDVFADCTFSGSGFSVGGAGVHEGRKCLAGMNILQ